MTSSTLDRSTRILLAKPGLDGHDRGIKVVGMALRDAGMEVVYLGLRQSITSILNAAEQEDVDAIGLSILSGVHLALTSKLLMERERRGLTSIAVFVGGTIPAEDHAPLHQLGVSAVFTADMPLERVVDSLVESLS